jgi:hypothetical protein
MKNLYAIKCLQSVIDTHQKEIERLCKEDGESYGATIFIEEEIKERKEYISQLKKATKLLK